MYGENAAALDRLTREVQGLPEITPAEKEVPTVQKAPAEETAAPAEEKPALPSFEDLWKVADEPIDWTEALTFPAPLNQDIPPEKWEVYFDKADAVLRGDPEAYLTVLATADPMADLRPFVADLEVTAPSGDELRATFAVREDLMADDPRAYLCGLALRMARDLFAVLPVNHVVITATSEGKNLLTAPFTRQGLHKVRFAFIDPVEFALSCGAVLTPEA